MIINSIYWREPLWALICLFPLLLMILRNWQQHRHLNQYADKHLHPWIISESQGEKRLRRYGHTGIQILAWLLIGLAAAGPRLPVLANPEYLPRHGAAMLVLDLSRSMDADDVYPSRGEYVRGILDHWLPNVSHKLGIIVFAGNAHLLIPPTSDKNALAETSSTLRQLILPTHGSSVPDALRLAYQELSSYKNNGAVILITDGDFSADEVKHSVSVINDPKHSDTELHILGVGSLAETALTSGPGKWLTMNEQVVTTRLNEETLNNMISSVTGSYQRIALEQLPDLADIWQPSSVKIQSEHHKLVLWQELFAWFLIPGIVLYFISLIPSPKSVLKHLRLHHFLLILITSITTFNVRADTANNEEEIHTLAWQAWQKNDFETAAIYYAQITGYTGRMGEGASCFRHGDNDCATDAFSKAAWQADNPADRARAVFNLANSYFQSGDFSSANILYRDALRYRPGDKNTLNNLAFSQALEKSVAERLRQESAERSGRLGKGWRTTNIEPGSVIKPNTGVILVDPEQTEESVNRANLIQSDINHLLQKGLDFARLASSDNNHRSRSRQAWFKHTNNPLQVGSNVALWQRLIELEVDIPTHPEQPETISGVRPW